MLLVGRYCRKFSSICTKRYFKSIWNNLIIFSKKYIRTNLYILILLLCIVVATSSFICFPKLNTKAINYLPVRV